MHASVKTVSVMPLLGLGESGSATRSCCKLPLSPGRSDICYREDYTSVDEIRGHHNPTSCNKFIDTSVVSDSVRPHRWQPTRLPLPWDSPGKNTGVGCHFLLQCMKVKSESEVAQSCLTPSDPMGCSPPGPSIHGIFQARVLKWVAIAFSDL